ncbi:MAG: DinB family protein, partial [Gemmatimonadota bacterium]|nr:DinB family protein [Gemmatimonadota bacterium]
ADLTAALKASTANCARAYAQSDAASAGMIKLFGQDQTRLFALMLNATHNAEHYGNIVTYMRMKGMVPPSSQPAPPRP